MATESGNFLESQVKYFFPSVCSMSWDKIFDKYKLKEPHQPHDVHWNIVLIELGVDTRHIVLVVVVPAALVVGDGKLLEDLWEYQQQ